MTDETLGSRKAKAEPIEDEALGQAAPDPDEPEILDIPADLTPEDFDFDEFVQGARPNRHAVRVASRPDLLARMDMLVMRIEDAERTGQDTDELVAEYEEAKVEFEASRRLFIVEGRSTARRRQIEKRLEKLGVTRPGKKASDREREDFARTVMLHQLADQVVYPKGVTAGGLEALMEANEPAVDAIYSAAQRANTVAAKAPVRPDFSHGR
ncbi:hypothetical protein [Pseudactinotalea sp. Z1748]|uniref:hypothetical protein n=1 Tax=Pseudactinotalea sp. Z1748 TaxID=3413027 RepID=UPI003C7AE289